MSVNKNAELLPYYEKAKELLNYNSETGVFTWKVGRGGSSKDSVAGSIDRLGYIQICVSINKKRKSLMGHRVAWFLYHGEIPNVIDHINMDKSDNRISNIRNCTHSQNKFNTIKPSNNTSGFKGVYLCRGKWRAKINYMRRSIHIGTYDTAEEASKAYEAKAKELHKEFYRPS